MSKTLTILAAISTFVICSSFDGTEVEFQLRDQSTHKVPIKYPKNNSKKQDFAKQVEFIESSGVIDTINQFGYIGLFQFGDMALKDLKVTKNELMKMNKKQQHTLFWRYAKKNKKYIESKMCLSWRQIKRKYHLSDGALIYMLHRHGAGNTEKYLKHGIVHADGNGKKISEIKEDFKLYYF